MSSIRDIKRSAQTVIREAVAMLGTEFGTHKYSSVEKDGECEIERTFLGTVMALCPSGKYYTAWANSNLALCPRCKGEGCSYCGGLGSREEYEDGCFFETLEKAAEDNGFWIESGDGDPCDMFICRQRDLQPLSRREAIRLGMYDVKTPNGLSLGEELELEAELMAEKEGILDGNGEQE